MAKASIRFSLTHEDACLLRNVIENYREDLVDPDYPDDLSVDTDRRLKAIAERILNLL